jgi:carbohydrate-binding DOMON domain-containing protein
VEGRRRTGRGPGTRRPRPDFTVSGQGAPGEGLSLVIDGDLAQAQPVQVGPEGRWQAVLDTSRLIDPNTPHRLVAWSAASGAASTAQTFHVQPEWRLMADVQDPQGDDHGPQGQYTYPTDPSWGENRQMDLRRIRVWAAGGALRVAVTVPRITRSWNPPHGFDHVAFTLFIELPGQTGGARVMPQQNSSLPGDMRWHRRLRASGWSNALFAPAGATAINEGTPITPAATISTDTEAQTITFTLPPAALGSLKTLSGARLYVTTWDYDGGYRELTTKPQSHAIGGGDPATGARVMDDSAVIVLP